MSEIIETIENRYDNKETLEIVKDLLNIVINDITYMNDNLDEDILDLGNNNKIESEDFESLVSIVETINEVLK